MKFLLSISLSIVFYGMSLATAGYEITVEIEGFEGKEAYLGYHLMDKQYILDTVQVTSSGVIVFQGEEALKEGMYLLIMPPDNKYFPLLINGEGQSFSLKTKVEDPIQHMQVKNSPDNQMYYEYMTYLSLKVPLKNELVESYKAAEGNESKKNEIKAKLQTLDDEVKNYHEKLISKNPTSFTALLAKTRIEVEEPAFKGEPEVIQRQRYYFFKEHWFDNYQMADPRMLRSPELFKRISYYLEKLTPQHPDSISLSIDHILELVGENEESFKYYLSHYLNEYAKSKIVGMDAVYVHLVEKYYNTGKAHWVDAENLKKMTDNAKTLKPILVGKTAPDIKLYKKDNAAISLHDIESTYTLLIFWEPDCGHCKKTMPTLKEFYEKFKPKGVEVFSVCTKKFDKDKKMEEVEKCWQFLDEHEMNKWINVVDPFIRSRYAQIYDIRSTPRIFILDENKEIIVKGIGKEQLEEVMDQIILADQEKHENAGARGER